MVEILVTKFCHPTDADDTDAMVFALFRKLERQWEEWKREKGSKDILLESNGQTENMKPKAFLLVQNHLIISNCSKLFGILCQNFILVKLEWNQKHWKQSIPFPTFYFNPN